MNDQLKELLNKAVLAIRNKNFTQGEIYCKNAIALNPTIGEAYNLLSLIHSEQKDFSKSVSSARKAVLCAPNNLLFQNNLGNVLFSNGKHKEAINVFEKIIKAQPNFFQAYFNLGKYYKKSGALEHAKSNFEKVIELNPEFVPALNNLANILQKETKWQAALQLYEKALNINPSFPEIHLNIGHIHALNNQYEIAEKAFKQAIQLRPQYGDAYLALGNLYINKKDFYHAEEAFQKSISINPSQPESLYQLGNIYRTNGEFENAILQFKKLLSFDPQNIPAHVNLGLVYFLIADHENAKKYFLKALEIDPSNAESKFSLGKLFELDKKYIESKALYEELLKGNYAFNIQVFYELTLLKLRIADWSNYDELLTQLIEMTEKYIADPSQTFNLTPLTLNYFPVPDNIHLNVSKKYADFVTSEIQVVKSTSNFSYPQQLHNGKLRIGFLSPDFRLHAVGLLLKDVFKYYDRTKVEVYLYAIINQDDEYNASFKSTCDVYRDLSKLSHLDAARIINKDQVHALIDLAGYTSHCRPHILALEPAEIQASWLGYPNTSGSQYIQFILGDKWLLPEVLQKHYSEKFIHLNHAFVASPLLAANNFPSKSELGLPENDFIFCCFNSIYKISPRIFSVWMKILENCPKSVLWLSKENEIAAKNLKAQANQLGIEPSRLIFSERLPMDEYISTYQFANVFLDTFYYSAGSTAACALQAGVPVLTMTGSTNSSRMGASIVGATDQTTFIVNNEEEYIRKAIYLYNYPNDCQLAKENLKNCKYKQKLFDLKAFTLDFEEKILDLWQTKQIIKNTN